jgi:hypothetical protein
MKLHPKNNYMADSDSFSTPYMLVKRRKNEGNIRMKCDIENVDDSEMDDYDNDRVKHIRNYSFSPSKTPSKRGRDHYILKRSYRKNEENYIDNDPNFRPK